VSSGVLVNAGSGSGSFGTGGNVRTFNVGSGGVLDFGSSGWSTSAGTGIIKEGQGILKLSGDAAWVGGFTLNNGTIIVGGVNAMGGGATNTLTINSGTIAANADRDLSNKYGGGIIIGGDFQIGASTTGVPSGNGTASASLTFNNNVSLGSSTRAITIGANGSYTFSGVVSGSGGAGLTIQAISGSVGNVVLSGANTYTGATSIQSGLVLASNAAAFGSNSSGTTVASGAGVRFTTAGPFSESFTISGNGSNGYGALYASPISGTQNVNISGSVTLATDATISALATGGGGALQLSGGVSSGASSGTTLLTLDGNSTSGSNLLSGLVSDGVTGAKLGLVKNGIGTWVLGGSNTNTFSGGIQINSGTLRFLGSAQALGSNTIGLGSA